MLKNEKAVKGFIAATIKGWKDVIADNKLGIAAAKKKDPLIDEALAAKGGKAKVKGGGGAKVKGGGTKIKGGGGTKIKAEAKS